MWCNNFLHIKYQNQIIQGPNAMAHRAGLSKNVPSCTTILVELLSFPMETYIKKTKSNRYTHINCLLNFYKFKAFSMISYNLRHKKEIQLNHLPSINIPRQMLWITKWTKSQWTQARECNHRFMWLYNVRRQSRRQNVHLTDDLILSHHRIW